MSMVAAMAAMSASTSHAVCRTQHGRLFEGSEDATLWRAGLAFMSSGLVPSPTQGGLILLANMTSTSLAPTIEALPIQNMSSDFGFRPHGLHLDNVTQRLYAVSHSDLLQEEAIFVFDVATSTDDMLAAPTLRFRYLLTSPHFEYHPRKELWFLNDVAVVDGSDELYVTQLGPLTGQFGKDKALWRCTWREADVRADRRLPASCSHAVPTLFLGLNGITISPNSSMVYINDEFGGPNASSQIWPYRRSPDGRLTNASSPGAPIGLHGSSIDNVERDHDSGDLQMGQYARKDNSSKDAQLLAPFDPATGRYDRGARVTAAMPRNVTFQVSTSLTFGKWTLLGSPWDKGPYVCSV